MRTLLTLLVVALAAPVALGEDDKADKETKKFVGTWKLASGEVDGKAVADEHVKASKLTHAEGKVTVVAPHLSREPLTSKVTRVDPSKKPAEKDWMRDSGSGKAVTMLAIYEWVDDDTFRVCYDP